MQLSKSRSNKLKDLSQLNISKTNINQNQNTTKTANGDQDAANQKILENEV